MSKPRVVRMATWRELRVLVTTALRPKLLEHVDQPNTYQARNDSPWTVGNVPLLHIGAAGKAVPIHVAWERDTGTVSSFAASPQLWDVRVWKQVHAGGHVADIFSWSMRSLLVGSWPLARLSLRLGFRSSSRTRDGLPPATAVAIVRRVHDHVCGAARQCYDCVRGLR